MTRLQQAVKDLGHLASLYYLHQLGYSKREVEQAVRNGDLAWTRNGNLEVNHG